MKKILFSIFSILICGTIITAQAFADDKCVSTAILGGYACDSDGNKIHKVDNDHPLKSGEFNCACDEGNGSSVISILNLVIDIMTIGIGILGVLGITIVGIQYLTAGGSEEKTRKAKRRMFEIMIGLLAYVVVYALLKWLLPGFNGTGS